MSGRPWTRTEDRILRARYPHEPTGPIAKALGRSETSTYQHARILGLEKTETYMRSAEGPGFHGNEGATHRFPKGNIPWNAGLKGWSPAGSEKGHFKKGQRPKTWRPVGTEILDPDGYRWVKVRESKDRKKRWKLAHVILWEKRLGTVPRDKFVIFKNRDKTDIRIGNLTLVDRAGLMEHNSLQRYPKSIVRAVMAIGALNRKINERKKYE